ncbi:putative bifunctional diguanylate cyclase/phosphodiesterase [Amorphus sp. 3PC139-8]|uniref:putative bifunctional diguanylate cyclase/phosphodiesterase n=1 Tax=Amorphus sp. 3PC139-8 TaxID=2735676 RepID=UPI00345C9732
MHIRPVYLVIAALAVALQIFLISIDTFDRIYDFTRAHEDYQLDEAFTVFFALSLALLAILIVRNFDLRREIVLRRRAEAQAALLARSDALTGLPNRRMLQEEFQHRLHGLRSSDQHLGVFLLDLDRFKVINDTFGHAAGDKLLQAVSDRIANVLRDGDFIARLGGDEFALLVNAQAGEETLFRIAQRILTAVAVPFEADGISADVSVSIGIAVYPADGEDAETLMMCADKAMYQSKSAGRNTYALYDTELDRMLKARMDMETELKAAVREDAIVPYYQPLMDLKTMQPTGIEALARWLHPEKGVVEASQFIAIAEDTGLINEIFRKLLRQVCKDARTWSMSLPVAVNISATQFRDLRLADKIMAVLEEEDFDPARLEIEITETALLLDIEATRRTLATLKGHGVRIALDDFGTGYASLRQLRELPFDKVKIDGTFVHRVGSDEESRKIVASVIGLGQALGLATIAEGLESPEELDWVRDHGCEVGQGFLFSKPVEASRLFEVLSRMNPGREG